MHSANNPTQFVGVLRTARSRAATLCVAFLLAWTWVHSAQAADTASSLPILRLDAQASREVRQDTAVAVLFTERQGQQAGPTQSQVNAIVAAVIAQFKSDSALQVRSGAYSTYAQRSRDGSIEGWRTRAEVIIESRDIEAVSKACASVAEQMHIASIGFTLSTAAHQQVEKDLMGEAAANFQARALQAAQALGYSKIELIEASYNRPSMPPMPLARTIAAQASAAPSVPMQPGQSTVTVSFGGSFRLKN